MRQSSRTPLLALQFGRLLSLRKLSHSESCHLRSLVIFRKLSSRAKRETLVSAWSHPLTFQNHLRDRLLLRVRDRKRRMFHSEPRRNLARLPVKIHRRTPTRQACALAIPPANPVAPTRAQSLHRRFFRREARRVALHPVRLGIAITNFSLGINAPQKSIAKAFNRSPHSRDLLYINARPH